MAIGGGKVPAKLHTLQYINTLIEFCYPWSGDLQQLRGSARAVTLPIWWDTLEILMGSATHWCMREHAVRTRLLNPAYNDTNQRKSNICWWWQVFFKGYTHPWWSPSDKSWHFSSSRLVRSNCNNSCNIMAFTHKWVIFTGTFLTLFQFWSN